MIITPSPFYNHTYYNIPPLNKKEQNTDKNTYIKKQFYIRNMTIEFNEGMSPVEGEKLILAALKNIPGVKDFRGEIV